MSTETTAHPDDGDPRAADDAVVEDAAVEDTDEAVPHPDPTGDPAVDAATTDLARAAAGPLEARVDAFDAAHRALQDRLADVDG